VTHTLSEADSKSLLATYGVPFLAEHVVATPDDAVAAAEALGGAVVAKLCGDGIAHKTERGLVRLGLDGPDEVRSAVVELLAAARPDDGAVQVLVAPMVRASRELIAGVSVDAQFGPTVVLGVGGILAEAIADAVVRLVPIAEVDAHDMLDDLSSQALLGPFRGEPAVDRDAVVAVLMALSAAAQGITGLVAVDLNPLMIVDGAPVAVDALVELADPVEATESATTSDATDPAGRR
jgi:acetyl-CoA synthetase (ADP-forming)